METLGSGAGKAWPQGHVRRPDSSAGPRRQPEHHLRARQLQARHGAQLHPHDEGQVQHLGQCLDAHASGGGVAATGRQAASREKVIKE